MTTASEERQRSRWIQHHLDVAPLVGTAIVTFFMSLVFLLLAAGVRRGQFDHFDDAVLAWFGRHRSANGNIAFTAVTALGDELVVMLLTVGIVGTLLLAGRRRPAWALAAATVGGAILSSLFKLIVERGRPSIIPHLVDVRSWSFPSGHAVAATSFFATCALLVATHVRRRRARAFLVAWSTLVATLVAISRVYLGVHYPSDVAGGALVGLSWALVVVSFERALIRRHPHHAYRPPHAHPRAAIPPP